MSQENGPISNDSDAVFFAEERTISEETAQESHPKKKLNLLIADDQVEAHGLTTAEIQSYSDLAHLFNYHYANSAVAAKAILEEVPDMALVISDVIMDDPQAGLKLVQYIQEEIQDPLIRSIVVTGHPGVNNQDTVARDYNIDGYIAKSEYKTHALYAAIKISLRFRDKLLQEEHETTGLKKIIHLPDIVLADQDSVSPEKTYSSEILTEFRAIMCQYEEDYAQCSGFLLFLPGQGYDQEFRTEIHPDAVYADLRDRSPERASQSQVLSALGKFDTGTFTIPEDVLGFMKEACDAEKSIYGKEHSVVYHTDRSSDASEEERMRLVMYLEGFPHFSSRSQEVAELFIGAVFRIYKRIWDFE